MKKYRYTNRQRFDLKNFTKRAIAVHGNKYDYSKVIHKDSKTKVTIICPKHGEFEQLYNNHLSGQGCPKCGKFNVGRKLHTTDIFITKAQKLHGNKYYYSKVNYIDAINKVTIICPIHGEFEQKPNNHLLGYGCNKCGIENKILSKEQFVKKAQKLHGNKYDYSKVNYIDSKTKIIIICPIHGEFEQKPNNHLNGNGCPICKESKGEKIISNILKKYDIEFKREFKLLNINNKDKNRFEYDFYLPLHNILIEFHGQQHFNSISWFGGDKRLKYTQECDNDKIKLANYKKIPLIIFTYKDLELTDTDFEELIIKTIKETNLNRVF